MVVTNEPDVIFINGPSSAGKSTVIAALRRLLERPYFILSSDLFVEAGALPALDGGYGLNPKWQELRPAFFDGFHRTIAAMARAGNPLIVEHVLERQEWYDMCATLLDDFDTFFVLLTADADTIDERERERDDRFAGEGRSHLADGVHTFGTYDVAVDTSAMSPAEVAASIVAAIRRRS